MIRYAAEDLGIQVPAGEARAVKLSADPLQAIVVPQMGGELSSFVVLWQGRPVEVLYRALDYHPTPSEWTGRAPLLWPQPGKCRVPGDNVSVVDGEEVGSWQYEGQRFPMPGHGIVRDLPWNLRYYGVGQNVARAIVDVREDEKTLRYFPFAFYLSCTYRLTEQSLVLEYRVVSLELRKRFWFAIGNHVTFNTPFARAGNFHNCLVKSPTRLQYPIDADAFLSERESELEMTSGRALSEPVLWDTMLGGYGMDTAVVELHDPASFGMRTQQKVIKGRIPDSALRFVFWAEPERRYFCPEPWVGEPNSLNSRVAAVELDPGEEFVWEMELTPLLTL